jgi:hypothetical protein
MSKKKKMLQDVSGVKRRRRSKWSWLVWFTDGTVKIVDYKGRIPVTRG